MGRRRRKERWSDRLKERERQKGEMFSEESREGRAERLRGEVCVRWFMFESELEK